MNEYETRKNEIEIEKEPNKCSKKLLIKIIVERCIGHPFNNLTTEQIKKYKKNENLEKLELKINELDNMVDNYQVDTIEDVLKRNELLEESLKLSEKYAKMLLEE